MKADKKQFQLTLSEKQAQVIMHSLEVYTRLGMGQFRDALECLPLDGHVLVGWHRDMDLIGRILSKYTKGNVDGGSRSLGIGGSQTGRDPRRPWPALQLTLSEKQSQVLMHSLEVYARLGMGQFRYAIECLPLELGVAYGEEWHRDMDLIGLILSKYTKGNVDGGSRSLGIGGSQTGELAKVAWDLYQVVRHRLSWDRAVKEGVVPSLAAPRKWPEMLGVNYDEPMPVSGEPLAKIEINQNELRDGNSCRHPGCLSHVSHPCEVCGRIAGKAQAEA